MSSSIASLVLRRTLRRTFSLAPSPLVPRVLIPQTLTKTSPSIWIRCASSASAKAVSTDDKIKRDDEKIKRADEHLLRVLESEIECAEEPEDEANQEVLLPKESPFEIIDNPGDQSIILKRQFLNENIQVNVFMNFEEEEEEEDKDEDDDEDESDALQPNISLVVTINKGDGPTLEFHCNLDSEGLEIENMVMKRPEDADDAYEGPEFSDLDESLKKALLKYLAARGIKGSLYEGLREYMMSKDDREYIVWLKNLKEFVSK